MLSWLLKERYNQSTIALVIYIFSRFHISLSLLQFIKVHRFVLFACSQYFQELLNQQLDKHAVVFLKDVKFNDLRALVDFMYRGEVNISQYQLESFLQTAEALQIKGSLSLLVHIFISPL